MNDLQRGMNVQISTSPRAKDDPEDHLANSVIRKQPSSNFEIRAPLESDLQVGTSGLYLTPCSQKQVYDEDNIELNDHLKINAILCKKTDGTIASGTEPPNEEQRELIDGNNTDSFNIGPIYPPPGTANLNIRSRSNSDSSLSSSESTHNLIKSLSLSGQDINQDLVSSEREPDSKIHSHSAKPFYRNLGANVKHEYIEVKKPIKFTVRKVSREEKGLTETKRYTNTPVSQRYGNLPENRAHADNRKQENKLSQLEENQAKYDQYSTRVDKIEKEIRFLSTLLPPHNVEIDYATRTKILRAIDKLGNKKDEVEKKRYELGTSISRLWRDFEDNNTWVRSVSKH